MYVDDIKLFAKNEKELETLIELMRIYSDDIGMKFGIEKCAMLKLENGIQMAEEINYPIKEKQYARRKRKFTNSWEYLKRTRSNKRKFNKNKKFKGPIWRTRKLIDIKLHRRILIKVINS